MTRSAPCRSCGAPRVEIVLSERLGVALWCECCHGPAPQTPAPAVQRITTRPEDLGEIRRPEHRAWCACDDCWAWRRDRVARDLGSGRSWSERIGDGIGASSLVKSRLVDLGRRAIRAPDWRWLPGMLARRPDGEYPMRMIAPNLWAHVVSLPSQTSTGGPCIPAATGIYDAGQTADVPDLDDDATRGCVLRLVREAWRDPLARTTTCMDGTWRCVVREHAPLVGEGSERRAPGHRWFDARTEAEALVEALFAVEAS